MASEWAPLCPWLWITPYSIGFVDSITISMQKFKQQSFIAKSSFDQFLFNYYILWNPLALPKMYLDASEFKDNLNSNPLTTLIPCCKNSHFIYNFISIECLNCAAYSSSTTTTTTTTDLIILILIFLIHTSLSVYTCLITTYYNYYFVQLLLTALRSL